MKENLIISAVGDNSLHKHWIEGNKDFDLFLIYYGDSEEKYKNDCEHYLPLKGNKYLMFHHVINKHPDLFNKYERLLILDDDLYTETDHLNNFFKIFKEQDFWLAQPSLMGWYTHEITLHDPKWKWRCTNFVEIMCPCFSKKALEICLDTFIESDIGWGIDWVWTKLLGYPEDKIAIIDDAIVLHSREIKSGDFYKNNKLETIDSMGIMKKTLDKYQVYDLTYKTFWKNSCWKNINCQETKHRIYPHLNIFKSFLKDIRVNKRIPFI